MAEIKLNTENLKFYGMSGLSSKELEYLMKLFENKNLVGLLSKLFEAQIMGAATELVTNVTKDFDNTAMKAVKVNAMADVTQYVLSLGDLAKEEIEKRSKANTPNLDEYPAGGI